MTVKSQHSPSIFYSCKWSANQIKANCRHIGLNTRFLFSPTCLLNKEQTGTDKKQDGAFMVVLTVLFFLFCPPLAGSMEGHEISVLHSEPWVVGIEMMKKKMHFFVLFSLFIWRPPVKVPRINASGADGEGTRSRAGKHVFQNGICVGPVIQQPELLRSPPCHALALHPSGPFTLGHP